MKEIKNHWLIFWPVEPGAQSPVLTCNSIVHLRNPFVSFAIKLQGYINHSSVTTKGLFRFKMSHPQAQMHKGIVKQVCFLYRMRSFKSPVIVRNRLEISVAVPLAFSLPTEIER